MSSISFDNIYLLLIAIPIAAIVTVPFFAAVKKENANRHNVASFVFHILMAIFVAFAAAGTSFVTVITETNVFVVADVSYSAYNNLDTVDSYIENVRKSLPRNSKLGIVCFGKDAELLTGLGGSVKSVSEAAVDASGTDIVNALEYTSSLFKDDVIKRIVLITDGGQTESSDSTLRRTIESLRADNIHVDAIYLNDNIDESVKEVQVTSVDAASNAYLNHEETAVAVLQSSYRANVTAELYRIGVTQPLAQKAVSLSAGSNTVSFTLDTSATGSFVYEVRVTAEETDGDTSYYNNSCYFTQTITGTVRILLITGQEEDYKAAQILFGEDCEIDAYVNDKNVPYSVEDLCLYDEIVLSNVDVSTLTNATMFMSSLDTVVSLFGKSLLTFGNLSIQNRTDEELTQLDDMLPVRYGNNDQDPKLYALVIDSSRSMQIDNRLVIAKQAAAQLVGLLNEDDYVCVFNFYGDSAYLVYPPVCVADESDSVIEMLNNLQPLQGTLIGKGLRTALDSIANLDYSEKQVMLISDGLSFGSEPEDPVSVAKEIYQNGITVSTLGVGKSGDDAATTGQALLQEICAAGGGNYYYCYDPSQLDGIMFGDIADDMTESKIEATTAVKINRRYDDVLSGLDMSGAYVNGFYVGKAKASANVVLTVDYTKSNGGSVTVPLYAYWSYGNGKAASFTSALTGDWLLGWQNSGLDELFISNVISTNTPSERIDYPYALALSIEGNRATVTLTPAELHADARAQITVTLPSASFPADTVSDTFSLEQSVYVCTFELGKAGSYTLAITYSYGGNDYTATIYYYRSYLPEYDSFAVYDSSVLVKSVGGEGTVSLDGNLSLENDDSDVGMYVIDLTVPLLALCAVLFVTDIIVRKLRWSDIKSLFGRGKE